MDENHKFKICLKLKPIEEEREKRIYTRLKPKLTVAELKEKRRIQNKVYYESVKPPKKVRESKPKGPKVSKPRKVRVYVSKYTEEEKAERSRQSVKEYRLRINERLVMVRKAIELDIDIGTMIEEKEKKQLE